MGVGVPFGSFYEDEEKVIYALVSEILDDWRFRVDYVFTDSVVVVLRRYFPSLFRRHVNFARFLRAVLLTCAEYRCQLHVAPILLRCRRSCLFYGF